MAKQKHLVKCKYCGKIFDANAELYVKPTSNRYAHKACYEKYLANQTQEEKDEEELYQYIKKLFNGSYNFVKVKRTIDKYKTEYNFTYSGMKKALVYFYEVKGHSIDKSNGNVGIIPYIYSDARNYYYSIWLARQKNEDKKVEDYLPEEKIVKITPPKRKVKHRKLFSFLDKEDKNAE